MSTKGKKGEWKNPKSKDNGKLGGRPSGCTDENIDKIEAIIESYEPWYDVPVTKTAPDGTTTEKMERSPNGPLTRIKIAKALGVTRFALWDWEKESDRLSNLFKKLKLLNEEIITDNTLLGLYDRTAGIFLLKQEKYGGLTDKQTIEHEGNITLMSALDAARKAINE